MNIKPLRTWAGLASIAWMVGVYELLNHAPEGFFLFKFDPASWVTQFAYLSGWLGVGLLLGIIGLRCGKPLGQILAVVAVLVFVYFAWDLLYPADVAGKA